MNRPLLIAALGLVVVVSAIALNYLAFQEEGRPPVPPPAPQAAAQKADPSLKSASPSAARSTISSRTPPPSAPSFDVVRITLEGDAVIAGRAEPDSVVDIRDGDKVIGRIKADDNGEWVFLPETPLLAPGNHRLSLEMQVTGFDPIPSEKVVVLVVPEPEKDIAGEDADEPESKALALAVPREGHGASRILQSPTTRAPDLKLAVDVVDYDDEGNLAISGRAGAGTSVYLYLDGRFIGRAEADGDGAWTLSPKGKVAPGLYPLRADQLDPKGKVVARVSLPFSIAEPITDMTAGSFIVVQPGNSLWRLARKLYGSGFSYTVIFKANKDQIRDPDLIYPGQVFTLPVGQKSP